MWNDAEIDYFNLITVDDSHSYQLGRAECIQEYHRYRRLSWMYMAIQAKPHERGGLKSTENNSPWKPSPKSKA